MKNKNSKFTRLCLIGLVLLVGLCVFGLFEKPKVTYSASDEDYILYGKWQLHNTLDLSFFDSGEQETFIDFKDGYGNSYGVFWTNSLGISNSIYYSPVNWTTDEVMHVFFSENNNYNYDWLPSGSSKKCDKKNGYDCRMFYYENSNGQRVYNVSESPYSILDFGNYGSIPKKQVNVEQKVSKTCYALGFIPYSCDETKIVPTYVTNPDFYNWFIKNADPLNKCYSKGMKWVWTNISTGLVDDSIKNATDCDDKNMVSLTFDSKGGTFEDGTSGIKIIKTKIGTKISVPTLTKDGTAGYAWSIQEGFFVNAFSSDTYTVIDGNNKYYAFFKYKIIYDANGGTIEGKNTKEVIKLESSLGNLPVPDARENYIFDGWYTNKVGGDLITEDYVLNKNMTVYAHWIVGSNPSPNPVPEPEPTPDPEPIPEPTPGLNYTIEYYNISSGVSDMPSIQSYSKKTNISLMVPIRFGYIFNGWNTKSDCSGRYYNIGEEVTKKNLKLYTCWSLLENDNKCTVRNH